jgi:hypothetical protein
VTYIQEATDSEYELISENMWCEGRESGPDPVEDPDCSNSWTISMSRIKEPEGEEVG